MSKISQGNLKISADLFEFLSGVLKELQLDEKKFWNGFDSSVHELAVENKKLLAERDKIQKNIDNWHIKNKTKKFDFKEYKKFLHEIGYIKKETGDFQIDTSNVDNEIAKIAGPQLVVPVDNARYAINAANARWGSFYNALYGTDAIPGERGTEYNAARGNEVINYVRDFLDEISPIENTSWKEIEKIEIKENNLVFYSKGNSFLLKNKKQFIGYTGKKDLPASILLLNNNLHVDIVIDPNTKIGKLDKANISDVILESAISTIVDNEDSVAAVDSTDKIKCYKNWLGLMKGNLEIEMVKNGKKFIRKLNKDRNYISPEGKDIKLHGRALLLNRNVGHLMTNPAIILKDNSEIPEGIMDAFVSTLCAMHDFKNKKNSRTGSVYIVKPKMHGPDEVKFTDKIFEKVEEVLKLEKNTIKVGIMDEERRTTVNLKECIKQVKSRIVFINTGFLDRTGDEMHTSFQAGPMIFKGDMKSSTWLNTYENWNVDVGLECGFSGKAQIGKGMWAIPDKMSEMIKQKIVHPKSGANCAWVPSPTAATLHSTHYHKINVFNKQKDLASREKASLDNLLMIPTADRPNWNLKDIEKEIENNAQSILGYVVRWIDQGVGCSKVPDINNIGLMEDRATLRISSQHIANWLHHKVCDEKKVLGIMKKMATIVDDQNKADNNYQPMSANFDTSIAFKAACDLVFKGISQPSGYTEPLLHKRRLEKKQTNPQ
tara:strand:+ start:593 stop:2740 length:2148 start_codon:yes stop_codon:yes gene_type:complete